MGMRLDVLLSEERLQIYELTYTEPKYLDVIKKLKEVKFHTELLMCTIHVMVLKLLNQGKIDWTCSRIR
jgi:hypothetical protein